MSEEYKYRLIYNGDTPFDEYVDSPEGWDEYGISFVRNEFYHSIRPRILTSLRFDRKSGGGGEWIKLAYDEQGLYADVSLYITKRNPQTDDYDAFYNCVLNFNKYSLEREYVDISAIDNNKEERFFTRDNISYNLRDIVSTDDVTVTDFANQPKDITFKEIDINLNVAVIARFDFDDFIGKAFEYLTIGTTPPSTMDIKNIPFLLETTTTNAIGDRLLLSDDPDPDNRTIMIYQNNSEEERIILTGKTTWQIYQDTMNVLVSTYSPSGVTLEVIADTIDSDDNVLVSRLIYTKSFTSGTREPVNLDITLINTLYTSWTIPAGGSFRFYFKFYPTTPIVLISYISGIATFDINFTEISPSIGDTTAECFFLHEAFTRLAQLSTSETDTSKLFYAEILGNLNSEFQSYGSIGDASNIVITNGFALRKFANRAINVNTRDLFKTIDATHNLGLGFDRVNDRFYIAPKREFYDSSLLLFDIGEVAELKTTIYENGYFNKIISGFVSEGDYEDLSGASEFNVQSEHSVNTPIKKTKDLRTEYNLDSISIEITRRKQYDTTSSEDTKRDDDIFLVKTNGVQTIQGNFDAAGIDNIDQYYNIALTARENLIRNGSIIKPSLYKTTELIKFVKNKKKTNISYFNQNSEVVNEFDDIEGTEITEDALFIPELYEFESYITTAQMAILLANPHGYIKFNFDGIDYEGFIDEAQTKDYNRKVTYKLIAKAFIPSGENKIWEDGQSQIWEDDNNRIWE